MEHSRKHITQQDIAMEWTCPYAYSVTVDNTKKSKLAICFSETFADTGMVTGFGRMARPKMGELSVDISIASIDHIMEMNDMVEPHNFVFGTCGEHHPSVSKLIERGVSIVNIPTIYEQQRGAARGFAIALDFAIKKIEPDYIIIMHPDHFVDRKHWVDELVENNTLFVIGMWYFRKGVLVNDAIEPRIFGAPAEYMLRLLNADTPAMMPRDPLYRMYEIEHHMMRWLKIPPTIYPEDCDYIYHSHILDWKNGQRLIDIL